MSNNSQNPAILELTTEASLLTQRLQSIIDVQAALAFGDALPEESTALSGTTLSLRKTRSQLRRTMLELASINDALADIYMGEYTKRERKLKEVGSMKNLERKLKERVRWIREDTKEALELKTIEKQESLLQNEIDDLESRLLEKKTQLVKVKTQKTNLTSIISSKASSYLVELENLKQKRVQQLHQVKFDNHHSPSSPSSSITAAASTLLNSTFFTKNTHQNDLSESNKILEEDEGDTQIEILNREIDTLKDHQKAALRESTALVEGVSVWKSVCTTLTILEQSIKRICTLSSDNMEKQTTDLEKVLNDATSNLERLLGLVRNENWELLVVAISHELEAIYRSQNIIRQGSSGHVTDDRQAQKQKQDQEESKNTFLQSDDDEQEEEIAIDSKKNE